MPTALIKKMLPREIGLEGIPLTTLAPVKKILETIKKPRGFINPISTGSSLKKLRGSPSILLRV
jgi:hypothetical protein